MSLSKLAIVESPLQLLCAYEALGNSKGNHIILRLTGVGKNDQQTQNLAKQLKLRCFVINAPVGQLPVLFMALWRSRSLLCQRYHAVYLGSYFSRFIRVIGQFARGPIFLLDDGMATILAQKKMACKKKPYSLFTFFDVVPLESQIRIRHSFRRVRSAFTISENSGSYFIGQPLVEEGLMSLLQYEDIVSQALNDCGGMLTYVVHRAESDLRVDKIKNIFGISVLYPNSNIELEFLLNSQAPKKIYSCCSTALITLKILFPESMVISYIPITLMENTTQTHLMDIVSTIQTLGEVRFI